ncbi:hypothetical protein CXG81DRAFT_27370 [Caulochytrium protostelioides]|uniref:Uncharacterized protein n=1 Tax=Caulochytrium protostelioides TaxID=1555241 RepID=A0A4P9X4B2_9FUNG|nr:hypothetical protein CXG81DRAFT_27370 [Caulochytrium protostelioides]|eukprot:RKO99892.1 hypothetical protein CXG81DRAFT_27370 [Caulochytrium protostelioides]
MRRHLSSPGLAITSPRPTALARLSSSPSSSATAASLHTGVKASIASGAAPPPRPSHASRLETVSPPPQDTTAIQETTAPPLPRPTALARGSASDPGSASAFESASASTPASSIERPTPGIASSVPATRASVIASYPIAFVSDGLLPRGSRASAATPAATTPASARFGGLARLLDTASSLAHPPPAARGPEQTFWTRVRDRHNVAAGIARARTHLLHPAYAFPDDFLDDARAVVSRAFALLSDRHASCRADLLRQCMTGGLAAQFAAAHTSLAEQGLAVRFRVGSSDDGERVDARVRRCTLTGLKFTYGPYPVPPGYIAQDWYTLITLVLPATEAAFGSYARQQALMQAAMEDGVYMRVDARCQLDLAVEVYEVATGRIVERGARRKTLDVQFTSPHYTPWDEIFALDDAGHWRLAWQWRLTDIDHTLFELRKARLEELPISREEKQQLIDSKSL